MPPESLASTDPSDDGLPVDPNLPSVMDVLEGMSDAFVAVDEQGRYAYINAAAERVYGRSRDELIGQAVWDAWPESAASEAGRKLQEAMRDQKSSTFETYYAPFDKWFDIRISPTEGKGAAIYFRDVTELKRINEALVLGEQRYRMIVENASDFAIFSLDREGRIVTWNTGARNITGFEPHEVIGKDGKLLFAAEDIAAGAPEQEMQTAAKEGRAQDLRWHVRKDESRFWGDGLTMRLMGESGELLGFVKVVRDKTAEKQALDRLESYRLTLEHEVARRTRESEHRAAELQSLAVELTHVEQRERRRLAHLLHDHLQQLLAAAKLQIAIAAPSVQGERAVDALSVARRALDEAIDASRTLSTELSPPILFQAGWPAAMEWMGRWIKDKHGLVVHTDCPTDVDSQDHDVLALLFQSVRELLFNIVKHAGVHEAWVTSRNTDGNIIEVVVLDRGRGFTPGQQGQNPDGFGLSSITHRLPLLGGSVKIDSAPGTGTRVTLRVPASLRQDAQPGALIKEPHRERRPGVRVVVADHHKLLREGLASLLSADPAIDVVGQACDGAQAVEMTQRLQPDVVVMDVHIQRVDGVEATRLIKSQSPSVRVIGLSSYQQREVARAIREAGAEAYLSTENAPDDLLELVRNCARESNDKPDYNEQKS